MTKAYWVCCYPECTKRIAYIAEAHSHPIYCEKHMKVIGQRVRKEAPWLNEDDIYWVTHRENRGKVRKSKQVKLS